MYYGYGDYVVEIEATPETHVIVSGLNLVTDM